MIGAISAAVAGSMTTAMLRGELSASCRQEAWHTSQVPRRVRTRDRAVPSPRPATTARARKTVPSIHIGTPTPRSLGRSCSYGSSASHALASSLADSSPPSGSNSSSPGRTSGTGAPRAHARVVIADWKDDSDHRGRHSALCYQPPVVYAASRTHR